VRAVFISSGISKTDFNKLLEKVPDGIDTLIMYSDMLPYISGNLVGEYFLGQWVETKYDLSSSETDFVLADCERIFEHNWLVPVYWCLEYPKSGGLLRWLRNYWEAITKTNDKIAPMLYFNEFGLNNWFGAELMLLICKVMKLWLGERFIPIFPCFSDPSRGVSYPCCELWGVWDLDYMIYSLNCIK
jgi:hypothetical protein